MSRWLTAVLLILIPWGARGAAQQPLIRLDNCVLVPTEWADGDSFLVRAADGKEFTLRLYGADCLEWHVNDETDARRLRARRLDDGIGQGGRLMIPFQSKRPVPKAEVHDLTIIHAQWIGGQAVLPRQDFDRLLELARRSEPVIVESLEADAEARDIMRLAENGGAFDYWHAPGEDVYSTQDGEAL